MTAWLRALVAALPLPHVTVVFGDYVAGDVVYGAEDDECGCDVDPDAGQPVLVVLPIDTAAEMFEQAVHRGRNGDDPAEVGWELARTLELGGDL